MSATTNEIDEPALPYRVEMFPYGTGHPRPTKVYPGDRGGPLLTADEQAVWARVEWLEAERVRLQDTILSQAERIAGQSEIMGRKAERPAEQAAEGEPAEQPAGQPKRGKGGKS